MSKKKTILLIGGGGYVGTELVDHLLQKKYKVIVYDLFIYGNFLTKDRNLSFIYGNR